MIAAKEFYQSHLDGFESELSKIREKLTAMAVLRFVAFVAAAFLAYQYLISKSPVAIISAVICFIIFLVFVRISFKLADKKRLLTQLVFVNRNELTLLAHQRNAFDNGAKFGAGHEFAADLDVFGEGSLYHLLNRTTTSHGAEEFASLFNNTDLSAEAVIEKQEAIRIMSQQPEKRQLLAAHGLMFGEAAGNLYSLTDWLQQPTMARKNKLLVVLRWVVPIVNLGVIYYVLDSGNTLALVASIAVCWLITASQLSYINTQHLLISKKQEILDQYAGILKIFSEVDAGDSGLLTKLKSEVKDAHHSFYKLARISGAFDQRVNMIVSAVLNSFFIYDIHCLFALEKWKDTYRSTFHKWIGTVGEIERINSLATFAFNNPTFHYPAVDESSLQIAAANMAHPLIREEQRISNSITIGESPKLLVVTGSNMSGKTTFLRTLGINLLLAQCGAPVCATSFRFRPMHILSSIRVSDSLQENTSYFMAELKQLHHIVERLETGYPSLVLIDEILRGTNSDDKTHGSEQFIRKLIHYNCLTLFATHDLLLGVLAAEKPEEIANYCFESVIENGELYFDYKLREGIARNRNASFLMKKMGIIQQ